MINLRILILGSIFAVFSLPQFSYSGLNECRQIFSIEATDRGDNPYWLTDQQSTDTFGFTEKEINELNLPMVLQNDYRAMNQLASFLWWTPAHQPGKREFLQEVVKFVSNYRLDPTDEYKAIVKNNLTEDKPSSNENESPEAKAVEYYYNEKLSMIDDLGDEGLSKAEMLAVIQALSSFVFVDEEFRYRPQFDKGVGFTFALAFLPHRRTLIQPFGPSKAPNLQIQFLSKYDEFLRTVADEQDGIAAFDYLMKPEIPSDLLNRLKIKMIFKDIVQKKSEDHAFLLEQFKNFSIQLMGQFIARNIQFLQMNIKGTAVSLAELKGEFIKQLGVPPRVASFMANLFMFCNFGELPPSWDAHQVRKVLSNALRYQVGHFRRTTRMLLKNRTTGESENTEKEIFTPIYYPIVAQKKNNQPQTRNPNKRKNSQWYLKIAEPEAVEFEEIPVPSPDGREVVLYDLLPYDHSLKKEMRKVPREVINRFQDVHLPEILMNPKRAGKSIESEFPKNWYRYDFTFGGVSYRVAYIATGGAVELVSLGTRERFYDRLKLRIR